MGERTIMIVGAGFAGAATAYHLAKMAGKQARIVIVEREEMPGIHSSGRNAGVIFQVVSETVLHPLIARSAAFIRARPNDAAWPVPTTFEQHGVMILASGDKVAELRATAESAANAGIPFEWWDRDRTLARVPVLEHAPIDAALFASADGMVDIHALLFGYLRVAEMAGAEIRLLSTVVGVETEGGRVTAVRVKGRDGKETRERVDFLVNGAGAWAGELGSMAGAASLPLRPTRRHLFTTVPVDWVDRSWPFVEDAANDWYLRPESGGLLLGAMDHADHPPIMPDTDPAVEELLAEKLSQFAPRLLDIPILTRWAGLRTLTPDGCFAVGPDPKVSNFVWVAGLGGHGVGSSWSVGELAARTILEPGAAHPFPALDPARFAE